MGAVTKDAVPGTHPERDRRLLAWLGAGLLAGGIPTHEVEADLRALASTLGHPRAQVACLPRGVWVTLSAGQPSTFEAVEGGLRLEQLADGSALLAGLRAGRLTPDEALASLAMLRSQPHRYRVPGLAAGGVLSGVGIALVLAPAWPSVVFAALLAPVTVVLMLLSGRNRTISTLTPLLAAFVTALVAFSAASAGWVSAPLWTLVAPIAVLLPGATIVTGLVELAAGSMVGGTSRLGHGTVQLLLFALGVGAAVALLDVPGGDMHPVAALLEEIDRRHAVQAKCLRGNADGDRRIAVAQKEVEIDCGSLTTGERMCQSADIDKVKPLRQGKILL